MLLSILITCLRFILTSDINEEIINPVKHKHTPAKYPSHDISVVWANSLFLIVNITGIAINEGIAVISRFFRIKTDMI